MNNILRPFLYKFVIVYMDDILIYCKTKEEHERYVRIVKDKLMEVGLKLNMKKCEYGKTEIKIFGHVIVDGCVKVDPEKVRAIEDLPLPSSRKKLQSFLGLFNYSSKHIRNSYKYVKRLYDILRLKGKEEEIFWKTYKTEAEYIKTIEECKLAIEKTAILMIPDLNKKFILTTGASTEGIGAVLSQEVDGEERIVSYYSALNSPAERNYSTMEQELLGVIKAIQHFREYLIINRFELKTDHKALTYLFKSRNMKAILARWSLLCKSMILI
ncbi:Retrovirus-related Pol polyprotein from transposon 17.6 [Nosema granulosis]|uniref:Retrovirus-related Pol polyprotein from transposon 17.6 n=1 Tax=Nosema granulosis TaxID=83296 RepID=A0A9P6GWX5_9MICR|nr:Retrovirus-related Pol polyprotein from transposon 17.6 [Nosema granulosis]